MDELISMITSKVGLDAAQAKAAVGVIMGFMKDKLPADVMNQLGAIPGMGDLMGGVSDAAGAAAGAASDAAGAAADAAGGLTDSVKGIVGKG